MNGILFWKSAVIGFCIAAPVGPCGLLCISRSLRGGFRTGVATGLGVTMADAFYAAIAIFGVSALSSLLQQWAYPLRVFGALFLMGLGLKIAFSKASVSEFRPTAAHSDFVSSFLVTLANPLTIFSFIAIFAGMGLTSGRSLVVLGVAFGSLSWWVFLSWLSAFFGKRLHPEWIGNATRLAGWIIVLLGGAAFLTAGWNPPS